MKSPSLNFRRFLQSLALIAAAALASGLASAQPLTDSHPGVRAAIAVQNRVTPALMSTPGIFGTAVGADDAGAPVLVVYVDRGSASVADLVRSLPPQLRGITVRAEVTDKFRAFAGKPGSGGGTGISYTARQTAPIQLGTSGGWRSDLANGYCCGGTLGSLVQVNGIQYILSNYHVLEADIVTGGNNLIANTGDAVIQPGLIDVGCNEIGRAHV